MKLSPATSALLALASAVAVPGTTHEAERIPVPEGFFESHIGSVGFTLVPAEPLKMAARAITHVYVCINADFKPACSNLQVNTGSCCMSNHSFFNLEL
jgi:hypothetical protein